MGILVGAVAIRVSQGWVAADVFPIIFALAAAGIQTFALLNARSPAGAGTTARD